MTMSIVASVTMKDGSLVRTTMMPLTSADQRRRTIKASSDAEPRVEANSSREQIATIIDAAPTTEPTERSNSPPIISMPIGNGDDAEIGGGVEPVGGAERRSGIRSVRP